MKTVECRLEKIVDTKCAGNQPRLIPVLRDECTYGLNVELAKKFNCGDIVVMISEKDFKSLVENQSRG